ncbi:hypothetical protein A4G29_19485 [Mycobacterium kansasii]|nr:hypothetical protein A4G29_19485 [Mycobacterium kansasii]
MVHRDHQHVLPIGYHETPGPRRDLVSELKRRIRDGLTQPGGRPFGGIDDLPTEVGFSADRTGCWGIPSTAENTVRRLSWWPTTSATAAFSASVSSSPRSRNATALL